MLIEKLKTKIDLPEDILVFHRLFDKEVQKLFVVGGAVRDFVMRKKPHDYDLVTDALPEVTMKILKDFKTDLQGVKFGIVRVFTKDEPGGYEIASYRKDISKGRNTKGDDKKVEIGKYITIEDDVRRRDLTINALYYDIGSQEIIDVVGGLNDIRNKIVRSVGNPDKRFGEDRLRIIRAIRFAATTGSDIDNETASAIHRDNRLFGISYEDDVSKERIFKEFITVKQKAKINNDGYMLKRFIEMLIEFGILQQVFPVLVAEKDIKPTTYLTVALAQTLRRNTINNEFKETLINARIYKDYVEIIALLIDIYKNGVDPKNIFDLYTSLISKSVRKDILEEWYRVMNIKDKYAKALLYYRPSVRGNDIIDDGFRGSEIGVEKNRRETEKFLELVDKLNESTILKFDEFKI